MLEVYMNKSSKLVQGIGNKGTTYPTWDGKVNLKEYKLWVDMLLRCTPKFWGNRPTYAGTTCSENFKSYTFFYEWCQEQVGFGRKDEKGKSWQLDKDLLIKSNKVYSEDTCVFIPQEVNALILNRQLGRGCYPLGVYFKTKPSKYVAKCCVGKGEIVYLGSFDTQADAFQAYKQGKEAYIKVVAENWKQDIDTRAYQALMNYQVEITD